MVGGDIVTNREDGSENWSDLDKFGSATDWINSVVGSGSPAFEADSDGLAYLNWLFHGAETVTGGVSAVQTVTISGTPTGGTFTLAYQGEATSAIVYNAAATAVQSALAALKGIGTGNVTVTGSAGGPYTITFGGLMARRPVSLITATHALTGGTTPSVAVANTTAGVLATHKYVPGTSIFYSTFWKRVGQQVLSRQRFNDCRLGQLVMEGSTANKALRVTPTLISLDPGEIMAADPTPDIPTAPVLIYTEAEGTFNIDGLVIRGHSQFTLTLGEALTPGYGDSAVAHDVVRGNSEVTLGVSIFADEEGLNLYHRHVYGTASPAAGAKPLRTVPALGSYEFALNKKDSAGNTIAAFRPKISGVKWAPLDTFVAPNPDGGGGEIALTGGMRKVPGQSPYEIDVLNRELAYS
jgi:hypothetical protein